LHRGWLGIAVEDSAPGVVVSEVVNGGPASRAGLLEGDVIQGVNRTRVDRALALRWTVATSGAGHWVKLRIRRGAQQVALRVRLDADPAPDPESVPLEGASASAPRRARPAGDR